MSSNSIQAQMAQARYKIIEDYIERRMPMAKIARNNNVSTRTLWNWLKSFQQSGISGLNRKPRTDKGSRRNISPEMKQLIREMLEQTPRPTITSVFRAIKILCMRDGIDPPSYSVVYDIARELSNRNPISNPLCGEGFEIVKTGSMEDPGQRFEPQESDFFDDYFQSDYLSSASNSQEMEF